MKILKNLVSIVFAAVITVSASVVVSAQTVLSCGKDTASDGCVLLGVDGQYIVQAEEALELINSYRYEACQEGVINPATGEALTLDDYVEIKWSSSLEEIARLRAVEASYTIAHKRLNGGSLYTYTNSNGKTVYYGASNATRFGEVLAWNWSKTMTYAIKQWYEEKEDWVNQDDDAVTGHYTQMIDPRNTYVGLATFYNTDARYYNTTAGHFCNGSGADETVGSAYDSCIQTIEVLDDYVSSYSISGADALSSSSTAQLSVNCTMTYNSKSYSMQVMDVTWSSSNTGIISVASDGTATVKSCGSATITATDSDGTKLAETTVSSSHTYGAWETTKAATCTTTGTKTRTCTVCGNTETGTIAVTGHTLVTVTGKAATCTATGLTDGQKCSVCGTVTKAQTTIAATGHTYGSWTVTKAATCATTGTKTRTCTACGNKETQTIAKTTTHTSSDWKISGSKRIKTCTVCGKTLESETLVKLSSCTVSGIKSSYAYTGKAITPTVTVKNGSTKLTKDTDYTVAYSSNKKTGKATVKITGKGKYTGTVTKTFCIVPKKVSSLNVTSPKTKQIKVTWKKDTTATGYQIIYATNSKFTKGKKTVNISKNSTVSKTIESLKKGTTYYVKVRAYKTVNGVKKFGAYSASKKIKCK